MKSTLLLLTISFILAAFGTVQSSAQCSPESLVFYRLTVYTFWSQQAFPKHFPDTRPVAQWSKLYGVSHTENLTLFQVGRLADKSLQTFAELGKTEDFESTLNHSQVLSTFYAPPIKKGVGLTSSSFFVNAEYSKISFVMKIHPSPDWFIGVDSLDLCQNGTWLHNQTIEAIPMDAGTDQGFTFTSPDYANEEPEPVFRIGLTTPDEPYGSFYYKNLTVLPTMAQFVITKVQEYTTKTNKAEHNKEDKSNNETSTVSGNLNNKNQTEKDTKNELSVHDKTTEKIYEDENEKGDTNKNSKGKDDKSGDRKEQGEKHKNVKEKQNKTPEGKDIKEHESSEEKELKTSENGTKQKDKPKNSEEKESKVENGKQRKGSKDKNNQHRTSKRTRSAKRKSADSRRTRDCKAENKKRHAKSKHSRDLIEMDLGRKKSEEITDLERKDLNRDIGYAREISPEQITNLESRHLNSEMDLSRKKSKEEIRDLESRETKVRRRKKLCVGTSTDVRKLRI
ncbi:hypothetical protein M8J75_007916 [Diaphorina citri]|nr:hypothetical protein M8J75_007916 [Diaphorina citri]